MDESMVLVRGRGSCVDAALWLQYRSKVLNASDSGAEGFKAVS